MPRVGRRASIYHRSALLESRAAYVERECETRSASRALLRMRRLASAYRVRAPEGGKGVRECAPDASRARGQEREPREPESTKEGDKSPRVCGALHARVGSSMYTNSAHGREQRERKRGVHDFVLGARRGRRAQESISIPQGSVSGALDVCSTRSITEVARSFAKVS